MLSNKFSVAFHSRLVKHPPVKGTAALVHALAAVILLHSLRILINFINRQKPTYKILSGLRVHYLFQ